jgi:hypothetical protein
MAGTHPNPYGEHMHASTNACVHQAVSSVRARVNFHNGKNTEKHGHRHIHNAQTV